MSREKQIEELTNELVFTSNYGTYNAVANYLVNKGYRKQSEWISVEDRLPEEDTRVLVYLNIQKTDANIYTFFDTDRILDGKWIRWRGHISHWMPLPEAPKMKGGE